MQLLSFLTPGAHLAVRQGKDTTPEKYPFPLGFPYVLWGSSDIPRSLDNLAERCYHTLVASLWATALRVRVTEQLHLAGCHGHSDALAGTC